MAELNDISALLSSLLSGDGAGEDTAQSADEAAGDGGENNLFGSIDPAVLLKILGIVSRLKENDRNTGLIMALKPLLKEENQAKADKAVMILKLLSVLPLLGGDDLF